MNIKIETGFNRPGLKGDTISVDEISVSLHFS